MRRFFYLAFIPVILFALEKVNLIKDHSFENNIGVWYTHAGGDGDKDSAIANTYDPEKAFTGSYCGSSDTRKTPGSHYAGYDDSALVMQGFVSNKVVADIDSLSLCYSISPREDIFARLGTAFVALYLDAGESNYLSIGYFLKPSDFPPGSIIPHRTFLKSFDIHPDTSWHNLEQNIKTDIVERGISIDSKVDSLFVMGWGADYPPWRGQKIYWDDIRLTGWADYDIGLTRISGDLSHPAVMVWNNGREDQTNVKVIATIEGGTPFADTVIVPSLLSDDSTEVTFKEYTAGSGGGTWTLTVVTGSLSGMSPDECDEDDILIKEYSGIGETPSPSSPRLEVAAPSSIRYSLPSGQHGTISLYDPTGRRVESLRVQGSGSVAMKASLASGVYFVKLETGHSSIVRKAIVLN